MNSAYRNLRDAFAIVNFGAVGRDPKIVYFRRGLKGIARAEVREVAGVLRRLIWVIVRRAGEDESGGDRIRGRYGNDAARSHSTSWHGNAPGATVAGIENESEEQAEEGERDSEKARTKGGAANSRRRGETATGPTRQTPTNSHVVACSTFATDHDDSIKWRVAE